MKKITEQERMSWESFWKLSTDSGMFDDSRKKTLLALRHFCKCEGVPSDVLDEISVFLFAPGEGLYGRVLPVGMARYRPIVYLAPVLESMPQEEVDYIFALELAHVWLNHLQESTDPPTLKDDADALVEKWGVLDEWFEHKVKSGLTGAAHEKRFADYVVPERRKQKSLKLGGQSSAAGVPRDE
jgi:hypothetical protein